MDSSRSCCCSFATGGSQAATCAGCFRRLTLHLLKSCPDACPAETLYNHLHAAVAPYRTPTALLPAGNASPLTALSHLTCMPPFRCTLMHLCHQAAWEEKQKTLRPEIRLLNQLLAANGQGEAQQAQLLASAAAAGVLTMNERYFFSLLDRMTSDVQRQPRSASQEQLLARLKSVGMAAAQAAAAAPPTGGAGQ